MERYESLGLVGEGSYGTVLKCRHRDSGRLVAIKKFLDSDDDKTVKKIAMREIKLLRQLRHDNLVNLLEVWKRRRRWHLVFEFVEQTLLDYLEQNPNGLELNTSRRYLYQILRAATFCHQQQIIHRDIKPENILISHGGVVKMCDFGFARTMALSAEGSVYTEYVATRWYRAPELLVGDTKYGKPVDVWAIGCLLIEMLTGQPLFPGDSDLDQIYHIIRCFGDLTAHHQDLFHKNAVFSGVRLPQCSGRIPLERRFPAITPTALDVAERCLQMDPERRAHCSELLQHPLFTLDSFHIRVLDELNAKIQKDHRENSTLPKIPKTPRPKKEEKDKNERGRDKKNPKNINEKFNKEKERSDKEGKEKKMPKTEAKTLSKSLRTTLDTSGLLMATKQCKTSDVKIIDDAVKTGMRSKPGQKPGTKPKQEADILEPTTSLTFDLLVASTTCPKDNNKGTPKSKTFSPEPKEVKDFTGSDNSEIWRFSKTESVSDFWKSSNTKVPKLYKSPTTGSIQHSSPKSLATEHSDTRFIQEVGKCSKTEYPTHKIPGDPEGPRLTQKTSQPTSDDQTEVSALSTTSVFRSKPSKTPSASRTNQLLSTSPSNSLSSDPSVQANPGAINTSSIPNQPARELPQVFTSTKNHQNSCYSLKHNQDNSGCLKLTKPVVNHVEMSNRKLDSFEPCGADQRSNSKSTIPTELRKQLIPLPYTIPTIDVSVRIATLKTFPILTKERRGHLALPVPIGATTSTQVSQDSRSSSESEPESLKPHYCKPLILEAKPKLEALSNHNTAVTHESRSTEDFPQQSSIPHTPTATPSAALDRQASTGSSGFPNTDAADMIEFQSCPPPPSFTVASTNSLAANAQLQRGGRVHPGTQVPWWLLTDKSPISEHSFVSDLCNCGNSNGQVAKKKSDLHLPNLRSSAPPGDDEPQQH